MWVAKPRDTAASRRPLILPVEAKMSVLIGLMAAVAALLADLRGVTIDLGSFAGQALAVLLIAAIAATYRQKGRQPAISLALANCAILILFSNVGAVLNYLLIAPGSVPMDPYLFDLDRMLGFDWLAFAEAVGRYPQLSRLLAIIYCSSLLQLVAVILLLALRERRGAVQRFVLCGMVASAASMAFWALFPSFGPASSLALSPELDAALGRVTDASAGEALLALARNGAVAIRSDQIMGLIAFPSMHMVMMLMTVWYLRGSRSLPIFVALNVPMIPAILIHGGHHLVDLIGGAALFAASAAVAALLVGADRAIPVANAGRPTGALASRPLMRSAAH